MSSNRAFDIVVFGASGYTGQSVVEYVARAALENHGEHYGPLKWAVAGRSESKMKEALASASKAVGVPGLEKNVPVIISDVADNQSIVTMVKSTRVLLNCVGPYQLYGEPVVQACVENATHHVDISGEPYFLESVQLKFHEEAEKAGVYVVGACGFDSIPADLGMIAIHQAMEGPVSGVETYINLCSPADTRGGLINFGTWQSAILGFAARDKLRELRRKLAPKPSMKPLEPKLKSRGIFHFSHVVNSWCFLFPGSDHSVMKRTQVARQRREQLRPAQVSCYFQVRSVAFAALLAILGLVFGILAKFAFGRKLLEKYPGIFSLGIVSKDGPARQTVENTNFVLTLVGSGWKYKSLTDMSNLGPEDRKVTVTVSGKNVGYGATCECMVQSALVILREADRMPGSGGVLTPGYAFANTSLIDRLNRHNVLFRVNVA